MMGWRSGGQAVTFEGRIEHATSKAYLVEPTMGEQCWIPKSQTLWVSNIVDDSGNRWFTVSEWIARKNGLI